MGLLLINILTLFLMINFKFGETIECYAETDLTLRSGEISISPLTTCDTKQLSEKLKIPDIKCFKSDCGEC
uniref:Uncharacterized protein n=1 Tax=Meloidogyne javanica TaxID=6303 RepID=A0A915MLN7_MELJA